MNTGASQYALHEAANASPLLQTVGQDAAGAVNSSDQRADGDARWSAVAPLRHRWWRNGASAASAANVAKPMPAASVPVGGSEPAGRHRASSASNFAAPGGSGGGGVNGGLLPSSAASLANPVATAGVTGAPGEAAALSSSAPP